MVFRVIAAVAIAATSMGPLSGWAQGLGGWSKPGMTTSRPHMMYAAPAGKPSFSVTCDAVGNMQFHVVSFVAAQQWPQPVLTIGIGSVERTKRPNLRLLGESSGQPERTVFEAEFRIADSVLDALARGDGIRARLGDQEQLFPAPPEAMRKEFVTKCAALVPPGMRQG